MSQIVCSNCGRPNRPGARMCGFCGKPLTPAQSPSAPQPVGGYPPAPPPPPPPAPIPPAPQPQARPQPVIAPQAAPKKSSGGLQPRTILAGCALLFVGFLCGIIALFGGQSVSPMVASYFGGATATLTSTAPQPSATVPAAQPTPPPTQSQPAPAQSPQPAPLQSPQPAPVQSAQPPLFGNRAGDKVIPFTLKDWDKNDHRFPEIIKDKVAVLVFWTVDTSNEDQLILLQPWIQKGVSVVAVNSKDNTASAREYIAKRKLENILVLLDSDAEVKRQYQVNATPTYFLIRRDGTIFKRLGLVRANELEKDMSELLAK